MIPAIVLAAGASSRMGRTKALLPLPEGDTFLARIEKTLRAAGIEQIVAVLGRDAQTIRAAAARRAGASQPAPAASAAREMRLVVNPRPEGGQLSSLLVGLDAILDGRDSPVPAILWTPVDLPLVSVDTVRRVIDQWQRGDAPIVRPGDGRRHGHPVIFSARLFEELRAADPDAGARAIVRAHQAEISNVTVRDPGAFEDIDTPADYRRIVLGE